MTYTPARAPKAHQREALHRLALRPSAPSACDVMALLMEMGTGKTKVVIDEFGMRAEAKDLHDLLIVAPAGSYRNWIVDRDGEPSELSKDMDPALLERTRVGYWRSGGGVAHKRTLESLLRYRDGPRVLAVNVEALSSVAAANDLCEEYLSATGRHCVMVIDESTRIKNYSARRTKRVHALGDHAAARRILTGLVAPRSPLDLWAQFNFLDWRIIGQRSYFGFRARYAIMKKMMLAGRQVPIVVGYRDVEDLRGRIDPYSYRVLKEDCLDLDPKTYVARDVELTDEQRKLYAELREFATARIGDEAHVTSTTVIGQIQKLHQMLSGFVKDEEGNVHDVPERRTAALLDVLEEHEGKTIIWTAYDHTIHKLTRVLTEEFGERSVARFWGGNRGTRHEDEYRFKQDPECRFMLATPAAGGVGNNWTIADLVVYYSNTYDLEMRAQSEDRAHRQGQLKPVTYVDLVARGTVDEKILHALRNKIDLASTITGENYREWLI